MVNWDNTMRQWIIYGSAIIVLGGAAWFFGKSKSSSAPTPPVVAAVTPIEPKEDVPPARLPEVIDLSRAYEPVREPEEVLPGGINPASFIAEPSSPGRIPYAMSNEELAYRDLIRLVRQTPLGSFLPGPAPVFGERIAIVPREIQR